MDTSEEQIREVFAHYGLAMYQAQCVERQLAMLLATVFGRAKTQGEYDHALETNFEKTMGKLAHEILRLGASETTINNLSQDIRRALETRNMLAHSYFWQRAAQFVSFNGREAMIDELSKCADLFAGVDGVLTQLTDAWASQHGVAHSEYRDALDEKLAEGQKPPPK